MAQESIKKVVGCKNKKTLFAFLYLIDGLKVDITANNRKEATKEFYNRSGGIKETQSFKNFKLDEGKEWILQGYACEGKQKFLH